MKIANIIAIVAVAVVFHFIINSLERLQQHSQEQKKSATGYTAFKECVAYEKAIDSPERMRMRENTGVCSGEPFIVKGAPFRDYHTKQIHREADIVVWTAEERCIREYCRSTIK